VTLCLYAVLDAPPRGRRLRGAQGEPLRYLRAGPLVAAVGEVPARPPLDLPALQAHDALVRALAGRVGAVLPARFASVFADQAACLEALARAGSPLAAALALVRGREQMTLRVSGPARPRPAARPRRPAASGQAGPRPGPGAAYLEGRRAAAARARAVPELDDLRPALAPLVKAERVEPHATPPLLATVHHLIPRGQAARYRAAVAGGLGRPGLRLSVSGPWAPYAFAPDAGR
jgi:hypothetical protein